MTNDSDKLANLLRGYANLLHQRDEAHHVAVTQVQGDSFALMRYYERRALLELLHRMEWHPGEPYEVAAWRMLEDLQAGQHPGEIGTELA